MDNSPLGGLPPEVRNTIYSLVFSSPDGFEVEAKPNTALVIKERGSRPLRAGGLVLACKQIKAECDAMFHTAIRDQAVIKLPPIVLPILHPHPTDNLTLVYAKLISYLRKLVVPHKSRLLVYFILPSAKEGESNDLIADVETPIIYVHRLNGDQLPRENCHFQVETTRSFSPHDFNTLHIQHDGVHSAIYGTQYKTLPGAVYLVAEILKMLQKSVLDA